MKYRRNKVKREHGIIQDALEWLEELGRCPEVTDVIPGVIEVSRSPERGIVYKYETQTGCKILLKSNGSIQEAFVVTKDPEFVRQWIETRFPSPTDKMKSDKTLDKTPNKTPGQASESQTKIKVTNPKKPSSGQRKSGKGRSKSSSFSYSEKWLDEKYLNLDDDVPSLGQRINSQTRQALRALQKNLSSSKNRKHK